ncbi:MAG TPA: hypothetical protein ENF92_09845 [Desulfobacteraceae bacterium]|nr:hypothetical protein [Desulfobacteraceae bacterium]
MRRYWGVCSISLFLLLLLLGGARNAMALTGGPDRYGYTYSDSEEPGAAPFSWIDISKTGTICELGNYDMSGDIHIGFKFKFYGREYDTVRFSSSGFITFKKTSLSGSAGGEPIPTEGGLADNMIAAFWDNLATGT